MTRTGRSPALCSDLPKGCEMVTVRGRRLTASSALCLHLHLSLSREADGPMMTRAQQSWRGAVSECFGADAALLGAARAAVRRAPQPRPEGRTHGAAVELTAAIKPTEGRRADRLADPTGQPVGFRIAVAPEPGAAHSKLRTSSPQL